jgi:hypothetical protein
MTDRSTSCALLHECGKCCWRVARGESAARNAQRICELRMAIAERLRLRKLNERWEREWEPCSNSGAQRGDARTKECCEECFGIEARCWASCRLKLQRCVAQ